MARGRKVNSNGERSKQLLLEKAIELFSIHGYHETKISDIVKAANLTQPTFYLYFQSKDKVFNDLNKEFSDNLVFIFTEKLQEVKESNAHTIRFIQESIESAFNYFYDNPNLTKIGFYEAPTANQLKDQIAQLFASILKNDRGSLGLNTEVEIEILAHSIVGAMERLTIKYILTKQQTPSKLANDLITIYFANQLEMATR
jgi:TetR/AcrR family transcriptional regulator